MKEKLNEINYVFPSAIISLLYLIYPALLRNLTILSFVCLLWVITFLLIRTQKLTDRIITLMILSIPVSFISVTGSTTNLVYLNWFNFFSILLLINLSISVIKNRKLIKFDLLLTAMIVSLSALIVSFVVNIKTINNSSITQLLMISFFILTSILLYTFTKISGFTKERVTKEYFNIYTAMTTIVALSVILQYVLSQYGIYIGRVESFGGSRVAYGYINFDFSFLSLLLVSNLFYLVFILLKNKSISIVMLLSLHILASLVTSARTGLTSFFIIVLLVSVIYILVFNTLSLTLVKRAFIFSIIFCVSFLGLYIIFSKRGFGGSGRNEVNLQAFNAISKRPLFGHGLSWVPDEGAIPHNFFIQYLVQMGFIFLVPLTSWIVIIMNNIRKKSLIIFLNMLVIFTGSMFIPDILNSRFVLVIITFGIISLQYRPENKKIKVAHLLSSGGYSGAELVAINIIKASPPHIDSVYLSPKGEIEAILNEENIHFIPITSRISDIVLDNNIDVIYAHDFKASTKASFSFTGVRIISHIHQNPKWFSKIGLKSVFFLLSSFNMKKIVFVSKETLNEFVFSKWVNQKSSVLPNYINSSQVITKSREMNKSSRHFDLAYLGRLEIVKNPIKFLKVIQQLKLSLPNVSAVMIGDGSLSSEVTSFIKKNDLNHNVVQMGYLSNPFPILKNSSILVIPSVWEGFGLSAVESMVLGVPVLASPVGGLKTVVNEESGYLCESTVDFVNSAKLLLENDKLLEQLSVNAIKSSQRFTDPIIWEKGVANIFQDIA